MSAPVVCSVCGVPGPYAVVLRRVPLCLRHRHGDWTRDEKLRMTAQATVVDYVPGRGDRPRLHGLFTTGFVSVGKVTFTVTVPQNETVTAPDLPYAEMRQRRLAGTRDQRVRALAAEALLNVTCCAYCERVGTTSHDAEGATWHLDHVAPLSKGGPDECYNLVKSCAACNLSKSANYAMPVLGTRTGTGHRWALGNYPPEHADGFRSARWRPPMYAAGRCVA